MSQAQKMISEVDLFARLPEKEMEFLASVSITREYTIGEYLFFEGEECQGIWIIGEGLVKVVKSTPSGRQLTLAMQPAPSTIAEVPVFDGGEYPASVSAVTDTHALLILRDDFFAMCRRNPDVALNFLAVFGKRLRHLIGLVERITFGSIRQRLAHELLSFAGTGERFVLPETHEELANRLGTVREVVSRNLGRFQTEGMLKIQRRDVEILSREALVAEAHTEL